MFLSSLSDVLIQTLAATLDFDEMLRLRSYEAQPGGRGHQVTDDALLHGYLNDISHKSMISISV